MSSVSFDQASLADCTCDECAGRGRFADGWAGEPLESDSSKEAGGPRKRAAR